ncbi:MAG: hypothetical protein SVR81_09450 [Chloroflexota bacterium]|nr:hypothetical protein [Chloroflexota bacterium]
MNKWWVGTVLCLVLSLGLSVQIVQAQDGGQMIQGMLGNGTAGAALPVDLPVTLYIVAEADQTGLYETTSAVDGTFTFEDVDLIDGAQLIAVATYLDVPYYSESVIYTEGEGLPELNITVYETTQDSSNISVADLTILLNEVDGSLRVGEYYLISNESDETWIGSNNEEVGTMATTAFSLPADAQNLWFSGRGLGDRFMATEDGFVDTAPVVPGADLTEVFFSYELPFSETMQFSRPMYLAVNSVAFIVSELGGIAVSGEGITDIGTVETDSGLAGTYAGSPISAGEDLVFSVQGQVSDGMNRNGLEIGIAAAGLVAAVVVAYFQWRKPAGLQWPSEVQSLLAAIARLDNQFVEGELAENEYRGKRLELLEQVKSILTRNK